jgi:hypothetical protein
MANQDAPFGLRPVRTSTSSQRQNRYRIASGYDTGIFQGDLVTVATDGTITRVPAGNTDLILGVFNGCSYVDPNGNIVFSNYWPADATGTEIFANVSSGAAKMKRFELINHPQGPNNTCRQCI